MFSHQNLETAVMAQSQIKSDLLKGKGLTAAQAASRFTLDSEAVLRNDKVKFATYSAMIKKLQAIQAKFFADQDDLFNLYMGFSFYNYVYTNGRHVEFHKFFELLDRLGQHIENAEHGQEELKAAFLNSVLLMNGLVREDADSYDAGLMAVNNALEKTISLIENDDKENDAKALVTATNEMMQTIAPHYMSNTKKALSELACVLLSLAVLLTVPVALVTSPLVFSVLMIAMPFEILLSAYFGTSALNSKLAHNYLANDVKTSLTKISQPGFFNRAKPVEESKQTTETNRNVMKA